MIENMGEKDPKVKSQRQLIVEVLAQADYGELVTYERLGAPLGLAFPRDNEVERKIIIRLVGLAGSELENNHEKATISVPKEGYRIAHPRECIDIASQRQERSNRQLRRTKRVLNAANFNLLTESERAMNLEARRLASAQARAIRSNSIASMKRDALSLKYEGE